MAKPTPWMFGKALVDAGIFTEEQMGNISRIVIDSQWDKGIIMYVEMYPSKPVLDIFSSLEGIQIIGVPGVTPGPEAFSMPKDE